MKIYSDNNITQAHIDEASAKAVAQSYELMSEIDAKQARQITLLRVAVGVSFAVNALLALGLKYLA